MIASRPRRYKDFRLRDACHATDLLAEIAAGRWLGADARAVLAIAWGVIYAAPSRALEMLPSRNDANTATEPPYKAPICRASTHSEIFTCPRLY